MIAFRIYFEIFERFVTPSELANVSSTFQLYINYILQEHSLFSRTVTHIYKSILSLNTDN